MIPPTPLKGTGSSWTEPGYWSGRVTGDGGGVKRKRGVVVGIGGVNL